MPIPMLLAVSTEAIAHAVLREQLDQAVAAKLDFQSHVMAGLPLLFLAHLNGFMEHFVCLCEADLD